MARTPTLLGVLALLTAALWPLSAIAQDPEKDACTSFARSLELEAAGRYLEAINELRPWRRQNPDDYLLNFRMGHLSVLALRYDDAGVYFQQAILAEPASVEARNALVLLLVTQEKYAAAEQSARELLEIDSLNYFGCLRLSFSLRMQGKFLQAEQINRELLDLFPTDIKFLLEHGLALKSMGHSQEANATFERILLLDPNNKLAARMLTSLPPVQDFNDTAPLQGVAPLTTGNAWPQQLTFLPYYYYLAYGQGSIKERGDVSGFYVALNRTVNLLEFDLSHTGIDYKNGFILDQYEFTAINTSYNIPNIGWKVGVHGIFGNAINSNGFVAIFGGQYYELNAWDASVDLYVSRYEHYTTPLTVVQPTPKLGAYWVKNDTLAIRSEVVGYGIVANQDVGFGNSPGLSAEARLLMDVGAWGCTVYGWGGRQSFAVRNGGFLVFNLNEERHGGYGGELRYSLSTNAKLLGRVGREDLRDSLSRAATYQMFASALFSYSF